MVLKKFLASTSLALSLLFVSSQATQAVSISLNSFELVDSGKHFDWETTSKYKSTIQSAVNIWNAYKSGVIRPDSIFNIQDVGIIDVSLQTEYAGRTYEGGMIWLNDYYMKDYTSAENLNICTHELWHALGLWHNTINDVMYKSVTSINKLSDNDKASYDSAYKAY